MTEIITNPTVYYIHIDDPENTIVTAPVTYTVTIQEQGLQGPAGTNGTNGTNGTIPGIGDAVDGATWGSVLFVDSSGNLKQDNTGSPNYYGITAFNNTSDPANSSLRVGNAAGGGYIYSGQFTTEGDNPFSFFANGQVNANSGGVYYFDFLEEAYKRLADYNYSTETAYFAFHGSETSTTQTELGTIIPEVLEKDGRYHRVEFEKIPEDAKELYLESEGYYICD